MAAAPPLYNNDMTQCTERVLLSLEKSSLFVRGSRDPSYKTWWRDSPYLLAQKWIWLVAKNSGAWSKKLQLGYMWYPEHGNFGRVKKVQLGIRKILKYYLEKELYLPLKVKILFFWKNEQFNSNFFYFIFTQDIDWN